MNSNHADHDTFTPYVAVPATTSRQLVTPLPCSITRMILSAVMLLWLTTSLPAQIPNQPNPKSLPIDTPIEFNIGGDEMHPYEVALISNEFFQVHVTQLGVDVLLRLSDASGHEVARMNSPHKYQSGETLSFVAPATGSYRLEVTALNAKATAGKYAIQREASRTATAQDRRRVEVEHIFVEGMTARAIKGQEETAIQKYTEALKGWQGLADNSMADLTRRLAINAKAYVAFIAAQSFLKIGSESKSREAIKKFEEARGFYHEIGETSNEAASIFGMAQAAMSLGDEKAAIEFLKQTFPLYSKPEEKQIKADLLIEIAKYYYYRVGDQNSALRYFLLVHPLYAQLDQPRETAITATTIGAIYYKLGNIKQAYEFLNKALPLRKSLGDKCSELEMLTNLGAVYLALGQKAEALRFLRDDAVPLYDGGGLCPANTFSARNNLGKAYFDLGEFEQSQNAYLDALKASNDKSFQAIVNNNLGAVYYEMGEYQISLEYYEKALALYKGDKKNQATTQTNVGIVHAALDHDQLAIALLKDALKLRQDVGDKNGEAITQTHLSEVYLKLGDKTTALEHSNQALTLFAAVHDPSGEAIAFANAMSVALALGNKRLAIFYGKRSVNKFQELRGAARGIEGELQKNYLRTVKGSYQHLAELLVQEGLLEQAIAVLNLYQDQQFFDFNLDPNVRVQQAYLSSREENLVKRYDEESKKLRDLEPQLAELKRQVNSIPPGSGGSENLQKLEVEFAARAKDFTAVLKDAANELMKPIEADEKNTHIDEVTKFREALGKLEATPAHKAVSLYTLTGKDNFYVLLLTPDGVKAFSHPTKAGMIKNKVEEFLTVLSCPEFDTFAESADLYNIVFKSVLMGNKRTTLEAALEKYKPNLLLWSPGDPVDSIPMAALYDAGTKQFLVEKYQHAVFTRVRPDRIAREPKPWINGIGLGTAKQYSGSSPLPGVKKSLSIIFGDKVTGRNGLINGPALVDEQFTRSELENLNGKWPLVHIASHFTYFAGNSDTSALRLGNGETFSLAEMQKYKTLFDGVELLMLAGCRTSVRQQNAFGKEIDGFAELAQRLGANSVIATLWNIDDFEAPAMEIGFYRLYRDHQNWDKSEVLRQSQLNLLRGKVTREPGDQPGLIPTVGKEEKKTGCVAGTNKPRKRFTPDPKAPLAHPYYWAPFVLYGSSR